MNSIASICDLEFRTRTQKKVQTAVWKHLGILSKIRGGGNSAKFWVEAATSETIIVFLVYWTCM